jgi:alkylation response protein AidB-like acyl-CoA dehydrogenase
VTGSRALSGDLAARVDALLNEVPPASTEVAEFRAAQFDRGLAWVHHPEGEGGLGLDPAWQPLIDERLAAAGAADQFYKNGVGLNLVAPAVAQHGSPEQRRRYLRPLFIGAEIWCQLFSEPGAGSDLAGLATAAVPAAGPGEHDGGWQVNGQKVWTTLAHRADFGLLLARTDPDVPKHAGITAFIVDMHAPGVEVRGLREITGEIEFNEVFLSDVAIPDNQRVGAVGGGWKVALTMLSVERVAHVGDVVPRGSGPIAEAMRLWRAGGSDPVRLDEVMRVWCDAEVARLTNLRAAEQSHGAPGPEGSIAKLSFAEVNQRIYALCLSLHGTAGLEYPGGYPLVRRAEMSTMTGTDARKMFLRSFALSIEGGTSEIMRNILGERVLGLPPEPRTDKDQPWRQIRRS